MYMKSFTTVLFLIIVFASCKVPVATIASNKVPVKSNGFVYENDTVRITYDFWGNLGIMNFELYNKLDQSIYVDLKNSAFIPNENMISYWKDETTTQSAIFSQYIDFNKSVSKGSSKSIKSERVLVIPPHSKITRPTYSLIPTRNDINRKLEFRNYLAIAMNEKFEGKVYFIDNDFYVSHVESLPPKKARNSVSPIKFYAAKQDIGTHAYFSFKK